MIALATVPLRLSPKLVPEDQPDALPVLGDARQGPGRPGGAQSSPATSGGPAPAP